MKKFLIDLSQLPDEGKEYSGKLDPEIFDLETIARDTKRPTPRPLSPIHFSLFVQRFESELLLRGELSSAFEFECVRTLQPFKKTISLPEAAFSIEIQNQSEIDAGEALREEILIEVPLHPTCDLGDDPQDCELDSRYLAMDKPPSDEVNPAPPRAGDSRWDALDAFEPDPNSNQSL